MMAMLVVVVVVMTRPPHPAFVDGQAVRSRR
jgi:hypothetical protein